VLDSADWHTLRRQLLDLDAKLTQLRYAEREAR
jgi:hypothetical protein